MNLPLGVVLVVDDDINVLKALGRLDLGAQFTLRLCSTASEARTVIAKEEVEVALVDQHLGLDQPTGLDFLASLRERDADCFRIIFTGAADLDFAVSAINQGLIDAFLVKPWTSEHLISLLNQGCETALLRRHNRQLAQELSQRNAALEYLNLQLERMVQERTASLRDTLAKLQQKQQELVRLETQATVSQLVRGLAHELNNPLAAILGYSQRMQRRLAADPDAVQRLSVILREVDRCRGLVDQLRNFASPLDESAVICRPGDALREAAERLSANGIVVPAFHLVGVVPNVIAAPRSLARVFEQALDNARLAGAQTCWLSGKNDGQRVRLLFENDGATPDDAVVQHAFRPFFTTRAELGHRGLGLAISLALLREQDGNLQLDRRSDGQVGAAYLITLPSPEPERTLTPLANIGTDLPAPGDILVVDDDPMISELLSDCLGEDGFTVTVVPSRNAAIAAIAARRVRAVIADYHLADGNGIELLRQLIGQQPSLAGHVALVTGANDQTTLERLRTESGVPVLGKPFRLEQVQQLVRDIVSGV